jgi:hypothetical protein
MTPAKRQLKSTVTCRLQCGAAEAYAEFQLHGCWLGCALNSNCCDDTCKAAYQANGWVPVTSLCTMIAAQMLAWRALDGHRCDDTCTATPAHSKQGSCVGHMHMAAAALTAIS